MVKARNGIFSADPNIAYDVLYENQRGLFMFGQPFFSSQGLLQVDPPAWVDADFRYSPFDILSTPLPDPSWEWVWRTWYIDMTYDVDDQGWSYSFTFPSRSWHGSHVWFHGFVRRRRWIRKRRRVKDDGSEEEYPTALGIRDHNKARKAYSIVEGTTLNYFSVESSAEDDGGSTERTFTIGALMRRLKKVRLDREKIDAVERFVCLGKDDIVLLAPFMDRIVSYLIFQQSRRE
ncbi:meiotically up-regulated gene 65 protein, partial [Myxozyma melibiosi]